MWPLVRRLTLELQEDNAFLVFMALSFSLANNVRAAVVLTPSQGCDYKIPKEITDAMRCASLESVSFSDIAYQTTFEDKTFGIWGLPSMKELKVVGSSLMSPLMANGTCPRALKRVASIFVNVKAAGEIFIWGLTRIAYLELEGLRDSSGGGIDLWTPALLSKLKESVASQVRSSFQPGSSVSSDLFLCTSIQPASLNSLKFLRFEGFFNEIEETLPSTSTVFEFLSQLPLNSLSLLKYGNFFWSPALSTIQLPTVTELILDKPNGHYCRESLHHFLSSFPNLEALELQHWAPDDVNLERFCTSTDVGMAILSPCLQALLKIVGASSVETLRISEPDDEDFAYGRGNPLPAVMVCRKVGDEWKQERFTPGHPARKDDDDDEDSEGDIEGAEESGFGSDSDF
ncbi:hypothetical protein P7C70_g3181, partial [Phenoliferia sp. Uapishka_3]